MTICIFIQIIVILYRYIEIFFEWAYFLTKIKLRLSSLYRNLPINPGTFFRLTQFLYHNWYHLGWWLRTTGPMDKACAYGAWDSRLESWVVQLQLLTLHTILPQMTNTKISNSLIPVQIASISTMKLITWKHPYQVHLIKITIQVIKIKKKRKKEKLPP